ncbi:meiotic recombination protein REC8 homolog [Antennarius striatus]|uniref:meiotic recombination protein REC8 homolog n=1 Tax=Antennarius striatus TaxID=241820 RepID=UPI0035ADA574
MFYYPPVLKRHSGCFSTIWLVATKGIRVPRRDFLKVSIESTCDDIMTYVLEQAPPPLPGFPRPRFSLYLSSQLQYGVVIVFHRQCAILLEELQAVLVQLMKQRTSQRIDLDDHSRPALDFPDALSFLEETEGAPDPLFGQMSLQEAMPSPSSLTQMGQDLKKTSEQLERTSPAAAPESDITASTDRITLRETPPVAIPAAEFEGVDLINQLPDTLDFLLAQTDNFPEGDLDAQKDEGTPDEGEWEVERGGQEEGLEKQRIKELTGSTIELPPTAVSGEDATLLPQEEPSLSVEKTGPPRDQLTPGDVPLPPSPSAAKKRKRPSPELEDVPVPPLKAQRRRERQLIFFDPVTQLSQEALQQQIDNPQVEESCPVLLQPPSHRTLPAAELLNNPCTPLPEEVESLWRRAATVTPVSGSDLQVGERGPESTDSEKEREREMSEEAEKEEERRELVPEEVPRDVAGVEMFHISDQSSLPLEGSSQRDASREVSLMFTPDTDRSPVSRSVSSLQDIPEVHERAAAVSPGLQPDLPEDTEESVLFQSLLPADVDRRTVSRIFHKLLDNLSARKLRAKQDESYGDIFIFPGRNYEETRHLTE